MHDCEEKLLHEARIKSALENMPSEEETQILCARFKALSEPSRLKILLALRRARNAGGRRQPERRFSPA